MPARLLPGLVSRAQPPVTRPRLCPRHVQVQRLRETAYETLTKESAEKRDADVNMITVNKDNSLLQTLDVSDGARVGEVESLKSESHTQINRISGDLKVEVARSFAVLVHELSHLFLPSQLCEPASPRQTGLQAPSGRDQSQSERQLGAAASS